MELNEIEGEKKTDFCTECRKKTEYILQKRDVCKTVRGKSYKFRFTAAICTECGAEMSPPGLLNENIREMDEQFRKAEDIISIDDIKTLMKIYKLEKSPLSLSLGFDKNTVAGYMLGQIPSKENSDVMKKALISPSFMKECLIKNRSKIDDTAYKAAIDSASQIGGSPGNH